MEIYKISFYLFDLGMSLSLCILEKLQVVNNNMVSLNDTVKNNEVNRKCKNIDNYYELMMFLD